MAWTAADLTALESAIADGRGARTITFQDQSVTFGSVDEMLRLRAAMRQELNNAAGQPRTRYVATSKGL